MAKHGSALHKQTWEYSTSSHKDTAGRSMVAQHKICISSQISVVYAFDCSTGETEAGGYLWVWGQIGLQSLFQDRDKAIQRNLVSKN